MAISSKCSNNLFRSLYSRHFLINEKYITIGTTTIIYPQVKHVKHELPTGVPYSWSLNGVEMHFQINLNQDFLKIICSIK